MTWLLTSQGSTKTCRNGHERAADLNRCKVCVRNRQAKYYAANPDKFKTQVAKWKESNKERVKELRSAWFSVNHDKRLAYSAAQYAKNPAKEKESTKKWRSMNKEKLQAYEKSNAADLTDRYVKNCLKMPSKQITPELISLKREQLSIRRMTKEFKKEIYEASTNTN